MKNLILLGDSIFDNKSYVNKTDPDVREQVQQAFGSDWNVKLMAVDGDRLQELIGQQIPAIPAEADALVVSVGGNNALGYSSVLMLPAKSVVEVLDMFGEVSAEFEQLYSEMVQKLLALGKPLVLCTIYNPRYPDLQLQQRVVTALKIFNDCILRTGLAVGAQVIDLRAVCTEDSDFANPIEPSAQGGAKIAAAIAKTVTQRS